MKEAAKTIMTKNLRADLRLFTVSCATKTIGHGLMLLGIAAPGEPTEKIFKDAIILIPLISLTAYFMNSQLNSRFPFKVPAQKRSFDTFEVVMKFTLAATFFVSIFCVTEVAAFGALSMAAGLFTALLIINLIKSYRPAANQSGPLTGYERAKYVVKNSLKGPLRGAGEGFVWANLELHPIAETDWMREFYHDEKIQLAAISVMGVALLASGGFLIGGRIHQAIEYFVTKSLEYCAARNDQSNDDLEQGNNGNLTGVKSRASIQTAGLETDSLVTSTLDDDVDESGCCRCG